MQLRKLVIVGLVLLLSATAGCATPAALSRRAPSDGVPSFSVMTFNVHMHRASDEATIAAVGASKSNIVCLQEVTPEWADVLHRRYATQYPHMLFAAKPHAAGLAILSEFPLEDRGTMTLHDWHPAWNVVVTTPWGRLQIMNVHLRAMFDGTSNVVTNFTKMGKDHVLEMETFMRHALPDLPTLVVGDFNESPKGKAVRWLEARGFANALPLFEPKQPTWRGRSTLFRPIKMTIDHIMFDGTFEPLDAFTGERGGSDHYPVVAHLEAPAWAARMTLERSLHAARSWVRPVDEALAAEEAEVTEEDDIGIDEPPR